MRRDGDGAQKSRRARLGGSRSSRRARSPPPVSSPGQGARRRRLPSRPSAANPAPSRLTVPPPAHGVSAATPPGCRPVRPGGRRRTAPAAPHLPHGRTSVLRQRRVNGTKRASMASGRITQTRITRSTLLVWGEGAWGEGAALYLDDCWSSRPTTWTNSVAAFSGTSESSWAVLGPLGQVGNWARDGSPAEITRELENTNYVAMARAGGQSSVWMQGGGTYLHGQRIREVFACARGRPHEELGAKRHAHSQRGGVTAGRSEVRVEGDNADTLT